VGAALVVDVTQSVGALPFDVGLVQPDFLVAAGYKWLFCPYSYSFMYAAPHRQTAQPLEMHWSSRAGSRDGHIWRDGVLRYRDGWLAGARRYDVGERANFVLTPMAKAGLEQVLAWTPEAVNATLRGMTDRICETGTRLGFAVPASKVRSGHFTGLTITSGMPASALSILARHNVFVSVRGNTLRISPHVWVNRADMERLEQALTEIAAAAT
jgi:selenocysteine lyase/cysteine desulfurase